MVDYLFLDDNTLSQWDGQSLISPTAPLTPPPPPSSPIKRRRCGYLHWTLSPNHMLEHKQCPPDPPYIEKEVTEEEQEEEETPILPLLPPPPPPTIATVLTFSPQPSPPPPIGYQTIVGGCYEGRLIYNIMQYTNYGCYSYNRFDNKWHIAGGEDNAPNLVCRAWHYIWSLIIKDVRSPATWAIKQSSSFGLPMPVSELFRPPTRIVYYALEQEVDMAMICKWLLTIDAKFVDKVVDITISSVKRITGTRQHHQYHAIRPADFTRMFLADLTTTPLPHLGSLRTMLVPFDTTVPSDNMNMLAALWTYNQQYRAGMPPLAINEIIYKPSKCSVFDCKGLCYEGWTACPSPYNNNKCTMGNLCIFHYRQRCSGVLGRCAGCSLVVHQECIVTVDPCCYDCGISSGCVTCTHNTCTLCALTSSSLHALCTKHITQCTNCNIFVCPSHYYALTSVCMDCFIKH
jgi:hypothetical protein